MKPRIAGKDYELKLPQPHLSFSQISLFLQCPQRYYRKYVLGIEEPYTAPLFEGSILGEVLDASGIEYITKGKPLTLKRAVLLYGKLFKKQSPKVDDWGAEGPEDVRLRGEAFLKEYWTKGMAEEAKPAIMSNGVIGVQFEVRTTIAGVPMLGFVDLIEETPPLITDHKCASSSRYYNPDTSLQLSCYAVNLGIPRVAFQVFNKKTGKVEFKECSQPLDLGKREKWLEVIVSGVAEQISAGMFPVCDPEKNFLCSSKWCPHWETCRGLYF